MSFVKNFEKIDLVIKTRHCIRGIWIRRTCTSAHDMDTIWRYRVRKYKTKNIYTHELQFQNGLNTTGKSRGNFSHHIHRPPLTNSQLHNNKWHVSGHYNNMWFVYNKIVIHSNMGSLNRKHWTPGRRRAVPNIGCHVLIDWLSASPKGGMA